MRKITAIVTLLVAVLASSCTGKVPGSVKSDITQCATQGVYKAGVTLIPRVNDALVQDDFRGALGKLIDVGKGVTMDVLGCVVRAALGNFFAMSSANPDDATSQRAAENARTWLDEQGFVFGT